MTSEIYLGSPEESIVSWIKNVWLLTIPFYIEVLEGGKDGNVKLVKKGSPDEISLLYSFDNKNWSDWDYTTGTDLNVGEKLYLKSKTNNGSFSNDESSYYTFNCLYGSKVNVCGNIMSLLYNDFVDKKELKDIGVFYRLFYQCYPVTDASNLVLPATTLTEQCYRYMFYYCYNLIAAPELPATTLAQYCYWSMFANCTSLTSAPELPATTLAYECYHGMFVDCASLTSIQ